MLHLISRIYYWLTERLYDEFAWFYDTASWLVSRGKWDSWRKCALDFLVGVRMLEIGFGTGELLLEMARKTIWVVGLDSSAAMHRITRKKLKSQGFQVARLLGKVSQMPFSDHAFDTIISTFPAEFIFDPVVWYEVARLLGNDESSSQHFRGRFVVIGMLPNCKERFHTPESSSPSKRMWDEILTRIQKLAGPAGLDFKIVMRSFPGYKLPILIAEKSKDRVGLSLDQE